MPSDPSIKRRGLKDFGELLASLQTKMKELKAACNLFLKQLWFSKVLYVAHFALYNRLQLDIHPTDTEMTDV